MCYRGATFVAVKVASRQLRNDTAGVLRRLAGRDPDKASVLVRRLLKRPRFDWVRDGEELLRSLKPGHFARPPLPTVTPVS